VDRGADLDATNAGGQTADLMAARAGHMDVVDVLTKAHAKR
jgi:ankyrin repeat protein